MRSKKLRKVTFLKQRKLVASWLTAQQDDGVIIDAWRGGGAGQVNVMAKEYGLGRQDQVETFVVYHGAIIAGYNHSKSVKIHI